MHPIALLLAVLTTGWTVRLEAIPATTPHAGDIQLRLAVTNHSGIGAWVVNNFNGPTLTVREEFLDLESGRSVVTSTCSDDIYNTMNYNIYANDGETVNLQWQLRCFGRVGHASTYRITVSDLSLSESYQGTAVAVAHVRSNTLQLYLAP